MEADTKKLDQTFVLCELAIRSAIRTLQFVPNSHELDIGCGIGQSKLAQKHSEDRCHNTLDL